MRHKGGIGLTEKSPVGRRRRNQIMFLLLSHKIEEECVIAQTVSGRACYCING